MWERERDGIGTKNEIYVEINIGVYVCHACHGWPPKFGNGVFEAFG
jgi:hypothetical protein